jgi:hypothetical protein
MPRGRDIDRRRRPVELRHPPRPRQLEPSGRAAEIVARVNATKAVCDSHRVPLAAAALQFPLAHPAIVPGPCNVDEFRSNLELLRLPIPAQLRADLHDTGLLHPKAPTPARPSGARTGTAHSYPGGRLKPPISAASRRANSIVVGSSPSAPIICNPTGRPEAVRPIGAAVAGR